VIWSLKTSISSTSIIRARATKNIERAAITSRVWRKTFRETGVITDVEYTDEEQKVWQIVATKLEEIQAKRASEFYLEAKKNSASRRANSAAFGNEPAFERAFQLSARAD
jgi:phenylalanine-4-hydroxylase